MALSKSLSKYISESLVQHNSGCSHIISIPTDLEQQSLSKRSAKPLETSPKKCAACWLKVAWKHVWVLICEKLHCISLLAFYSLLYKILLSTCKKHHITVIIIMSPDVFPLCLVRKAMIRLLSNVFLLQNYYYLLLFKVHPRKQSTRGAFCICNIRWIIHHRV